MGRRAVGSDGALLEEAPGPEEADEAWRVHDTVGEGHADRPPEGEADRLDEFGGVGSFAPDRHEPRGEEDVDASGGEAGGMVGDAQLFEALGAQADLFGTFPARRDAGGFPRVDDAGGKLVQDPADRG